MQDVVRKFGKYGDVKEVRIVRGQGGESRGFGFVDMGSEDDAHEAIRALNQVEWNGRKLLVEVAKRPR
jgi:cold-inducible RNA-binding protein